MDRELLKKIILEQQDYLKKMPLGYPRVAVRELEKFVKIKHNIVITGHRRSGKSVLLKQIISKYFGFDAYFFNFSDERLINFKTSDFEVLLELFIELFGEKKIFFFDEIQGVPNWQLFVNRMYEQSNKFFLTGSNAMLLSSEISTHLTGRHLNFFLLPFSFKEFLGFKKISFKEKDLILTKSKVKIIKAFEEYLMNGGFPEKIIEHEPLILQEIFNDVVTKDVITRFNIKDKKALKEIAFYLISNIGKLFSYNQLKKYFKIGSVNTVKEYISHLCNAFVLFELNCFSYSLKKQALLNKKIYAIDTGLINEVSFKVSPDYGRLYENIVFLELKRNKKETYYWKNKKGKEIDFLIKEKNKINEAIQVCFDLNNPKTKEREINALISALKKFKLKKGTIITKNIEKKQTIEKKEIEFIPLWKWLLK